MIRIIGIILVCFTLVNCSQQKARKPISNTSNTFIKQSIERNKKLVASEEKLISNIIANDTLHEYVASSKGYWYKYIIKNDELTDFPNRGEIVYFDYDVTDLNKALIYSQEELGPQKYYVDKETIMMGLRNGLKLMKKGEKLSFIFPSHMAYGYHGDNDKIGSNEPLICTVTLNDIQIDKDSIKK